MAAAEVATQPSSKKPRPFTSWMKRLASRKNNDANASPKKSGTSLLSSKNRKAAKNNPYPVSGYVPQPSARSSEDGALSFAGSNAQHTTDTGSMRSEPLAERDGNSGGKRSAAPTVNTKAETTHSDTGHSKAATSTTAGGALSSIEGAGSTFSSPNQSLRSLTTTLTTIQSTSAGNTLSPNGASPNPVLFSHQYPVSPVASSYTASAIPRHISAAHGNAGNTLTDDASIMTLASSSKRRRRSMDTDASVRALAPSSVWGGSRESLPLSVLSTNIESSAVRPSLAGHANTERASVYSSQGIGSPVIASDRNSYYAQRKDLATDAKSLRSINNLDARSQYDAKSITDGKSMDVGSLRGYEGSVRSGAVGHSRQDSIPGSINTPAGARHPVGGAMSRRSSDWAGHDAERYEDAHGEREEEAEEKEQ